MKFASHPLRRVICNPHFPRVHWILHFLSTWVSDTSPDLEPPPNARVHGFQSSQRTPQQRWLILLISSFTKRLDEGYQHPHVSWPDGPLHTSETCSTSNPRAILDGRLGVLPPGPSMKDGTRGPGRSSLNGENADAMDTESIRVAARSRDDEVYRMTSHVSGPDTLEAQPPPSPEDMYWETGDEVYGRFSQWRKVGIVTAMSFCAFLSPISSTSVLAATPEVAAEYGTTGSVINLSNAGYMVFMGLSPIVWGPMSQVFGRRPVSMPLPVPFLCRLIRRVQFCTWESVLIL